MQNVSNGKVRGGFYKNEKVERTFGWFQLAAILADKMFPRKNIFVRISIIFVTFHSSCVNPSRKLNISKVSGDAISKKQTEAIASCK